MRSITTLALIAVGTLLIAATAPPTAVHDPGRMSVTAERNLLGSINTDRVAMPAARGILVATPASALGDRGAGGVLAHASLKTADVGFDDTINTALSTAAITT